MEQYEIRANRYFKNIQKALRNYPVEWIYIRFIGSQGGKVIISENMKGKRLTISRGENGLNTKIDGKKVFFWEITARSGKIVFGNRWSIAYERFDEDGNVHYANTGYPNPYAPYTGPDDPDLPKVKNTIFRSGNRNYLIEITFSGKIPIKKTGLIPGCDGQYGSDYTWEVYF